MASDLCATKNHLIDYYKPLFSETSCGGNASNLGLVGQIIPNLVSNFENGELTTVPNIEKVWLTVFSWILIML